MLQSLILGCESTSPCLVPTGKGNCQALHVFLEDRIERKKFPTALNFNILTFVLSFKLKIQVLYSKATL